MKYYNINGKAVASVSGKPIDGYDEWTNPVKADGTLLAQHEGIATLAKDANGNPYKYYNQDGTPDIARIDAELQDDYRNSLKRARDLALSTNEYALADGSVYQVRPSDLANFQIAIQSGTDRKWVLKDNTTRVTTVAELSEIMAAGISQAEVIWNDYATAIGSL